MRAIRYLVFLAVLAAICWSGWWYLLARGQEQALEAWFEARRQDGWQAEFAELSVTGYPFVHERKIRDLSLTDPQSGWSWQASDLTFTSAPHAPTDYTVALPPRHELAFPGERVTVTNNALSGRLALTPDTGLALRTAALDVADLKLAAQSGWTAEAARGTVRLTARDAAAGPPNAYNLDLDLQAIDIPRPVLEALNLGDLAESRLDALLIEAHAAFRDPIDRHSLENGHLALRTASISRARLEWGEAVLAARGRFEVDPRGYPVGEIDLSLRNWKQLIAMARRSGRIKPGILDAISGALDLLSVFSGSKEALSVPLTLGNGKIRLGPVAIADAPRLAPPLGS